MIENTKMNAIQKTTKEILSNMTKKDLLEEISKRDLLIIELIDKLESSKNRTSKRKQEVLDLLKLSPISIYDMSIKLDITNKNVSSQLCYLKKDGHLICTNSSGKKFLEDYDYDEEDNEEDNEESLNKDALYDAEALEE